MSSSAHSSRGGDQRLGAAEAYVWVWLPGAEEPVVCGRVTADARGADAAHCFIYGRSYRARAQAIALAPHTLPLQEGDHVTRRGLHGVLRDAAPDAWGRRALAHRLRFTAARADAELTELDYLLLCGQAPGAFHFQTTPEPYTRKPEGTASIEQLQQAVASVDTGAPLPAELEQALLHGTSVGGARPKALLRAADGRRLIVKFSSATDLHPMVRLEALGLALAEAAGIDTVHAERLQVLGRDALAIERFDVTASAGPRHFFSALTALDLDEMEARYAGYPALADYLRRYADDALGACRELYRRLLFNILIGNTDDHARNHALFWDGRFVALTPAYDVCVIPRLGLEASQAMDVGRQGNRATLANAYSESGRFGVDSAEARVMAQEIEDAIRANWTAQCDQAGVPEALARQLLEQTVLSPAIHY